MGSSAQPADPPYKFFNKLSRIATGIIPVPSLRKRPRDTSHVIDATFLKKGAHMNSPKALPVRDVQALNPPQASVPLRGYYPVHETEDEIWIQDNEATWLVAKSDVVSTSSWIGVPE